MPGKPASRDPWLDNIKWVLITFVVIGHFWSMLPPDSAIQRQAYDFLYYWHMPAFVLLSGYLSRSFVWDRRHLDALFATILLPYLIFEPLLYFYRDLIGHELEPGILVLDPHWGMWYLIVLFFWRLATPILKKHWIWIPISIVISLWCGTMDTTALALPRILGMLPFFVVGLHLTPKAMTLLRNRWSMIPAVLFLAYLWDLSGRTDEWSRTWFMLWNVGYDEMGWDPVSDAMRIRFLVILLAFGGIFSVLALVPRKQHFFTSLGKQTLIVYLIHLFFIRAVGQSGRWYNFAEAHIEWALVISVLASIGLALLLASPPSVKLFTPIVDPVGTLRRRRKAAAEPSDT